LSLKGCSLVALHADTAFKEEAIHFQKETGTIRDVILVVDRSTGKPFDDSELHDLGKTLLESTKSPMNVLSVKGAVGELEKMEANLQLDATAQEEGQITIIPRSEK